MVNYAGSKDAAEAVAKEICGMGVKSIAVQADTSSQEDVRGRPFPDFFPPCILFDRRGQEKYKGHREGKHTHIPSLLISIPAEGHRNFHRTNNTRTAGRQKLVKLSTLKRCFCRGCCSNFVPPGFSVPAWSAVLHSLAALGGQEGLPSDVSKSTEAHICSQQPTKHII